MAIPLLPHSRFAFFDNGRAGGTVFCTVGCGIKRCTAFSAELAAFLKKDLAVEGLVSRQDGTAIPFADERLRNHLDAGTGLVPLVQQQTVALIIVAAARSDLPPDFCRLRLCQSYDFLQITPPLAAFIPNILAYPNGSLSAVKNSPH